MIYSRVKRDEIIRWIREILNTISIKNIPNISLDNLNLSVRANNVLAKAEITTISDFIHFGPKKLCKLNNAGKTTIYEIGNAIKQLLLSADSKLGDKEAFHDAQSQPPERIFFVNALDNIFTTIPLKYLPIIKARYGYEDGKCKTLEEIGNNAGVTRERVRQIIVKGFRQIKHFKSGNDLQALVENIERLLLQYKGIVSIRDMTSDAYFASGTTNQLIFLRNLFSDLYENRYRIIFKKFLTSLGDDEIKILHAEIQDASLKCQFPINERVLMDIKSLVGNISKDYLIHHLLHQKLSVTQKIKHLMRNVDKPMHFSEIAKLYSNHFGGVRKIVLKTSNIEHAIHSRISNSTDFIIVNPGTFILRDKFKIPNNSDEIIKVSREILGRLGNISDTRYLINELERRGVNTGNLNAYSLKTILLEYPGFVSYRKFEIGIESLTLPHTYERKSLGDLIFEVLLFALKPMHIKAIWKELQKKRGFPEYAIAQRLADEPRFIRIAPATYTVAKNITQYKEKQKIIVDFAKEWINLKGTAISAFFVSEVLKESEEIKDFPLGMVEHVLAESSEFVKLPNAFYKLAND